jgi:hypothetical protein
MTTTMLHTDSTTRTTTSDAEQLRVLLHDALSVAADDAADSFDGGTSTGRALLGLAALARQAAGAFGAAPGITVLAGPGVVVVRELAAAVRLFDQAADQAAGAGRAADVDGLVSTAKGLHAQLHEAVAAPRR